jgi:diketogulonate reductase-like aldo/keto reductase
MRGAALAEARCKPTETEQRPRRPLHRGAPERPTSISEGIAFVPYFPLGRFAPLQSPVLSQAAAQLGATTMQVALAWLLRRAQKALRYALKISYSEHNYIGCMDGAR